MVTIQGKRHFGKHFNLKVQRGDQDSIEVLVDGIKKPIFSGDLIELPGVLVRQTPRGNNSRVIIIFNSGITVYIENAVVLQMAVSLPSIFKGKEICWLHLYIIF